MARWGMVIDLDKCTGCQACTAACGMENNRLPGENWHDVLFYRSGEFPSGTLKWFPRPCMHCENASCVDVCPTGATYKTAEGTVLINWEKCIGCKYCMIACPYGARFYTDEKATLEPNIKAVFKPEGGRSWNPPYRAPDSREDWTRGIGIQPNGVVSKCTFCYHRVSKAPAGTVDFDPADPKLREHTPACVVTCAPSARFFGDIDNPASKVSRMIAEKRAVRLRDQTGNKPQVYYVTGGAAGAVPTNRRGTKA